MRYQNYALIGIFSLATHKFKFAVKKDRFSYKVTNLKRKKPQGHKSFFFNAKIRNAEIIGVGQ